MGITSIHDKFFRAVLHNKSMAADYFRSCLPGHIADKLDFSTLVQLSDTYLSKELRKTISDIVYSCQRSDRKGDMKISLLIEHKSYIDPYTTIQIGHYIFSGMNKQVSDGQRPSLIIPVLLYHGKDHWQYQTLKGLFSELEPEFIGFLPDFEYVCHNLGELSDPEITALKNKFLAASLLAMKYSFLRKQLVALIPTILGLAGGEKLNLQNQLIVYTFENSGLKEDQILTIVQTLPLKIKETVMNTLDVFVEKGIKIGKEEGRKEGLLEGQENIALNLIKIAGLSNEQIAAATDLPVDRIIQIRKEAKSS